MENETKETTFKIAKENFKKFQSKLKPIQKKAEKFGIPAPSFKVLREFEQKFEQTREDGETIKWTETFLELEIENNEVKLSGWEFAATIDHREAGNIFRTNPKAKENPEILKYQHADSNCEHCSQQRRRNNTYLMQNEVGEIKQVGSSCIKDFLGHPSAEYYARLYEFMRMMEGAQEEKTGPAGSRSRMVYSVKEVLEIACYYIRTDGYASAKMGGKATSNDVKYWLRTSSQKFLHETGKEKPEPTETDKRNAQESIECALSFTAEETKNVFKANLQTLAKQEECYFEDIGMLCYLPEMKMKTMEERMKREKELRDSSQSNFIGEVGQRMTFSLKFYKSVYLGEGFAYNSNPYKMYIFKCGNDIVIWKTSNELPDSESGHYEVTGTIKAHTDYKGAKQTELTRCKAKPVEGPAKAS